YLGNDIALLFGAGDGSFRADPSLHALSHPMAIVAGQFDDSPAVDLAVLLSQASLDSQSSRVAIFSGLGGGEFSPPRYTYFGGLYPFSMTSADFDEDGRDDLFISAENAGAV